MNKFLSWLRKRFGEQSQTVMDIHEFRCGVRSLLSSHKTAVWHAKVLSYEYARASFATQLECSRELRKDLKQMGATG